LNKYSRGQWLGPQRFSLELSGRALRRTRIIRFVGEGRRCGSDEADFADLFRKAAHYVDKILKGTKPADLPVQQATKFEFIINLKAAKQIGLTLSPEFLSRAASCPTGANQVIKEASAKAGGR
jgi:nickel-dependent lactate racemase